MFDISRYASIAHRHGVPLIVDNTFATPFLCRPFEFGADIVTHSTSKYMDGHANVLGGVVIGLVESFTTSYISSSMADTFVFLILIIVLVIKPAGIMGKNVGEKV